VFATYQSSPQIAAALKHRTPRFDLAIADEAQRCAGGWEGVHHDPRPRADQDRTTKRIFLTLALLLDLTFLLPSGRRLLAILLPARATRAPAYLASQTWWDDGETFREAIPGTSTSRPVSLNNTLYGDVTLDVIVKMHNEQGAT
jgi:hypothetical protein